jgi:hypothetical protein
MSSSEPNTILEINESHTDNFILVIPHLPTTVFLSSSFQSYTKPNYFTSTVSTSSGECGDGPEFQGNTTGTSGTSGSCNESTDTTRSKIIRETNIDLQNFMLYLTDVTLPDVSIDKVTIDTPFATLSRPRKIKFGDLSISMKISENLINYNAILYWLYALHNPEEFNKLSGRGMIKYFFQEIYVIIKNNHREKVSEYKFIDAFPYTLSSLPLTYKDAENLKCDVLWGHSGMVPSDNFVLKYV